MALNVMIMGNDELGCGK